MLENGIIADCLRLNEAADAELPQEFRKFQRPFDERPQRLKYRRSHAWYTVLLSIPLLTRAKRVGGSHNPF